jgi:hypothetical protein
MKKQITFTLTLLAISLTSAMSQEWGQAKPQISVSGSAEVKVVPDEIYLNVGIETRDKDLQEAKRLNDDHVAGALDFLKRNDVKEKDVKTDYISIQPVYLRDSEAYIDPITGLPLANSANVVMSTKPLYYVVRKSIGIKLTNVDGFDVVLSGLITNGVNIVQGIDFRTSELRKYRDKARAMAIQAAKEKAEAMASELGVKLGKANSINGNDLGGWSSLYRNGWGQGGGGGMYQNASQNGGSATGSEEGTLSVGQISVSANVNVTFLIE